jgi:glucose-6-phosphate 1-dehydrogenase
VDIVFQPVPHRAFPPAAAPAWPPNRLTIGIQPEEQILFQFLAKEPGPELRLRPVHMRFSYAESFRKPTPEAYETLLLDVVRGDATLFMRADQVEAAWAAVTPVLEGWAAEPPSDFPNYAAGSWGPEAADALLARGGHHWLLPAVAEGAGEGEAPTEESSRVDGKGRSRELPRAGEPSLRKTSRNRQARSS